MLPSAKKFLGILVCSAITLSAISFFTHNMAAGPAFSSDLLKALKQTPGNHPRYQQITLKQGIIYYAIFPKSYRILPAVTDKLQTLDAFAKQSETPPLAVINAGYFDPENQQTISYITINGTQVADPTQNVRLTSNNNLKPYLPKIFNRSEFRAYRCQDGQRYDIVPHQTNAPNGCSLVHALGAGPQLLPLDRSLEEAVIDVDAQGKLIRDPFGVRYPNARSAIGITPSGSVILLMGSQNPPEKGYGFTFEQLRSLLGSLGATKAMALDGGSSSAIMMPAPMPNMPEDDKKDLLSIIYGKYTKEGQTVKRPVKSALLALPPQ